MKNPFRIFVFLLCSISWAVLPVLAQTLKFPPAEKVNLGALKPRPLTVGLVITEELQKFVHTERTSPFDKLHYPVGAYSAEFFQKNLPSIFEKVVPSTSQKPENGVDFVLVPSIVKFDAIVPNPAWKPYLANIVFRVDAYDKEGNKVFTQTTTGEGQVSKGMLSLRARKACTDATLAAVANAGKQQLEGLAAARELEKAK